MSIAASGQNLFIVDLHYIVDLDAIEPELDPHIAFLEKHYAAGHFIASGAKLPRTGGVIIATAPSRKTLEDLLEEDPFKAKGLARYSVTEFRPSMKAECLSI